MPNVRYLSFYINIYDAELQFPENKDEFVVFSCDRLAANNSIDMPFYMDETGVNIAPFLDIPDVGHCLFFDVNWSNQQRAIYHNISFFYKKMIFHGLEDNQGYNKFLGYPDSVQSCVALNAEKNFNGKQHEEWLYQALRIGDYYFKFLQTSIHFHY